MASSLADTRTFAPPWPSAAEVARARDGTRVTVCLPARDEEATVGTIVATVVNELQERHGVVDEVLVVDDGSRDGTTGRARSAGARVLAGDGRGKGAAMQRGLRSSTGDVVVFCDADVQDFDSEFVLRLVAPLLTDQDLGFVKGYYERPYGGRPGQGGRVTELVAKPLIRILFPSLSWVIQPLAGECAGRRELLEQVPFVTGYGVDIALLIDLAERFGAETLGQVDLGRRVHRNRPLEELGPQAEEVLRAVLARAGLGDDVPELCPIGKT